MSTAAGVARLRKVVALLDSPVEGEAVAALGRARQIARGLGVKVADALAADTPSRMPPIPVAPESTFNRQAMYCASFPAEFNGWERGFVASASLVRSPTDKQRATLERLFRRACMAAERRA